MKTVGAVTDRPFLIGTLIYAEESRNDRATPFRPPPPPPSVSAFVYVCVSLLSLPLCL